MSTPNPRTDAVTQLLMDGSDGDQAALNQLMPLVYRELRRLAHQHLNKENAGRTLQTTDLVHEAYLRLVDQKRTRWQNRAHFFGVAAQLMRRILVDRARRRRRAKRGGGAAMVSLDETAVVLPQPKVDMIAFDEALTRLAKLDQRKARIVELRYFGGLSVEESAELLKISAVTVMRDWKTAKAWLHRELSDES